MAPSVDDPILTMIRGDSYGVCIDHGTWFTNPDGTRFSEHHSTAGTLAEAVAVAMQSHPQPEGGADA